MSVRLQMPTYERLVKDITALYDHTRNTVVETYWKIGKRIVEEEQEGETKADYGAKLIARLSEDLAMEYGNFLTFRGYFWSADFKVLLPNKDFIRKSMLS